MAKSRNESAKKQNLTQYDHEFKGQCGVKSIAQTIAFLKTKFYRRQEGDPQFREHWDPDYHGTNCPLLIGDPGVGKSTIINAVAKALGYEVTRLPMGELGEEDGGGVVDVNSLGGEEGHRFTLPPWLQVCTREPLGNGGILRIDEIGTAKPTQQNQVAMLLTDAWITGYYGHKFAPGWFPVAATNPETLEFITNNTLDRRLRDRMQPIWVQPTYKETLHYLSINNAVPSTLLGFLRMHEAFLDAVSPRAWESLGQEWFKWDITRLMPMTEFLDLQTGTFVNALDTLNELKAYIKRGDDPNAYPLMARQIVEADDAEFKVFQQRVKSWASNDGEILMSATAWDISGFIRDEAVKVSDTDTKRLLQVMALMPRHELVYEALQEAMNGANERGRKVLTLIKKTPELAAPLKEFYKQWDARYNKEHGGAKTA